MARPLSLLPALLACLILSPAVRLQAAEEAAEDVQIIRRPAGADRPAADQRRPDLDAVAKLIVDRTNAFRKEEQRPEVSVEPKLRATAQAFAEYMARTGRYGHRADGRTPARRAEAQKYDLCLVTENIAYAFNSEGFATEELAGTFVKGWQDSPGHRKNMLDPDVTETGVGVAYGAETGHYFAVQLFGRPKAAAITFKVANESAVAVRYAIGERSYDLPPRMIRTHQECRPPTVSLELPGAGPGAKADPQRLRPRGGETYAIVGARGALRVEERRAK